MELEYLRERSFWVRNKTIDIGKRPICGGGRLERFFSIYRRPLLDSGFVHRPVTYLLYTNPQKEITYNNASFSAKSTMLQ